MSWPYITSQVVNAGTEHEPDFKMLPKILWINSKNAGPYQACRDCREIKKDHPKTNINWAIPGAARCAKHILRYHRDNGTLTDELKANIEHRSQINERLRQGAYA
jgi:hypothetical protein